MGFFAEFNVWLNQILANYIGANTARVAAAIEPAVLVLGTVYVMVWGYLELTGQITEPFIVGVKRIVALAVVFALALHLWLYNALIVDTAFNAPSELAAAVLGAFDPVALIDKIIFTGGDAGALLLAKGGVLNGDFSYYIAGWFVYLVVGLTAIYTIFLLALSRIALSVLLAIGPLFIAMLLFSTTKRFFEAWAAQLANYALITILTILVAALMLQLVQTAATQAANAGDGITIALAVKVCMATGLVLLVMRQVMPMAAGLSHGIGLSTFGVVSAALAWGFGTAQRSGGQFLRGAILDRDSSRYDSLSRKAGFYLRRGSAAGFTRLLGATRTNAIARRNP